MYSLYENLKNLAFYLEGQAIVPPKPKVVVPEYMEFLPRRQSSRIALTNIRSIADSDLGVIYSIIYLADDTNPI